MKIRISLSSNFIEKERTGFGTCFYSKHGHICVLTGGQYSPAKHSITEFVVEERFRSQGFGKELVEEIIRRYKHDIGGQASSKASVKVLYDSGFRMHGDKTKTLQDAYNSLEEYSSVYMRY